MRAGAMMFVGLVCACGPVVGDDDGDATTGSDTTTTADSSNATLDASDASDPSTQSTSGTPTTSTTTADPTIADTGDDCGLFVQCFDSPIPECDPWTESCLRGEKCVSWANDGGPYWNATRCSPIADTPGDVGDPCTVEGDATMGVDDCALGSMCMFVDPTTNEGVCVAHCMGTAEQPYCEELGELCVEDFQYTFAYCLPACDPFLQNCERGGCYVAGKDMVSRPTSFACGPTIGVGQPGDGCSHDWDCLPGTVCVDPEISADCVGGSCCATMCDLQEADACPDGSACAPLFPDDQSPGGPPPIGVCVTDG
jgi:hypothetical protein